MTASVDSFSTVNIKIPLSKNANASASLESFENANHVAALATKPIVVDYNGPGKVYQHLQQHSNIGLKPQN